LTVYTTRDKAREFVLAILLAVLLAVLLFNANTYGQEPTKPKPAPAPAPSSQPYPDPNQAFCDSLERYGWWWYFWGCNQYEAGR
jgi:hypothetical protein